MSQQEAEALEDACKVIDLKCPSEKKGKKRSLIKFVLKHLCDLENEVGEDDDQGFSTISLLFDHIKKIEPGKDSKELFSETPRSEERVKTVVDVMKLKDFKISGIIGGSGGKLSYTSLSYQIANAEKSGYPEERICTAVVRAVSPSSNLQTYLKSKPDLTLKTLTEILRSHFKEKDSVGVHRIRECGTTRERKFIGFRY